MTRPDLRVVRGAPTSEELAAVLTVLAARSRPGPVAAAPAGRSAWRRPVLRRPVVRRPVLPGHGGWRAAGLPGG